MSCCWLVDGTFITESGTKVDIGGPYICISQIRTNITDSGIDNDIDVGAPKAPTS